MIHAYYKSPNHDFNLLHGDTFELLPQFNFKFDMIFADPPYAMKEVPEIPNLILDRQLLKPEGLLVFEHGKDHDFSAHPHFLEHRSYGSVNFTLFR